MADGTAVGEVISQDIKRIFPRVREIIDENQKKNRAQNMLRNCLEELQPGQEEGMREFQEGTHVGCDRRGSLRGMNGDVLGHHRKRVW